MQLGALVRCPRSDSCHLWRHGAAPHTWMWRATLLRVKRGRRPVCSTCDWGGELVDATVNCSAVCPWCVPAAHLSRFPHLHPRSGPSPSHGQLSLCLSIYDGVTGNSAHPNVPTFLRMCPPHPSVWRAFRLRFVHSTHGFRRIYVCDILCVCVYESLALIIIN